MEGDNKNGKTSFVRKFLNRLDAKTKMLSFFTLLWILLKDWILKICYIEVNQHTLTVIRSLPVSQTCLNGFSRLGTLYTKRTWVMQLFADVTSTTIDTTSLNFILESTKNFTERLRKIKQNHMSYEGRSDFLKKLLESR